MPRYLYRCDDGHSGERVIPIAEFDATGKMPCGCGLSARRVQVPIGLCLNGEGFNGHRPTREARINLSQFQEAHGETLHEAEKKGVQAPDFFGIAKERVRTGAVKAYD